MQNPHGHRNLLEELESCRRFLLAIANEEVPPDLRAKGGASDLVQQTFVAALRWENQFRGESLAELRAWLRAILRSEAAVFRRQYYSTASRDVGREVALLPMVAGNNDAPSVVAVKSEERQQLSGAFAKLPEAHRRAVTLRMEHQMPFAEIGVRLDRSEDAARKLFASAIGRLRGELSSNADEPA